MSNKNPAETVMLLSTAYWASRCIHVVAEAGIADALGEEAHTAAALAAKTGTNAAALHRILRCLATHGVFSLKDGRFSHNEAFVEQHYPAFRDSRHLSQFRPNMRGTFALPMA